TALDFIHAQKETPLSFPCILTNSMDVVVHHSILVAGALADDHPPSRGSIVPLTEMGLCGRQKRPLGLSRRRAIPVHSHPGEGFRVRDHIHDPMFFRYETGSHRPI